MSSVFYRKLGRTHIAVERGEGVYLYDTAGKRYLDATGGPMVVNAGHGIASIAAALAAQASRIAYVHGSLFTTEALELYSQRLAEKVPLDGARFFYLTSGSEAVEAACKFARQVQWARGEASRDRVIGRWGSYHGASLGMLAVSGKPSMRAPYASMFLDMPHVVPPYCYRCPFDASYPSCDVACARELETEILRQGPGRVAGFLAEPVGGATLGAVVPPRDYWVLVREICDRHGVLLIADEVLTGFGRTGSWFAMSHFGVQPDVMALGKGATSGYFPLSAFAARSDDVEAVHRAVGDFNHGGTFSHHAVGAAAALATMDYIEGNDLVARAASLGVRLGQVLRQELEGCPWVGDVRGMGMLWAVEFVSDRKTKAPFPAGAHLASRICERCMEMGVLLYPGQGCADGMNGDHLMIAPPFVVSESEIELIVGTLRRAIVLEAGGVSGTAP